MYNLVIDIGNTSIKVAIYKGEEFVLMQVMEDWDEKEFNSITKGYFIKHVLISDVRYQQKPYLPFLTEKFTCFFADNDLKMPLINRYKTPETLGFDRLAQCVGARKYYSTGNLLVISCGTCITYNFVNDQNEFIGGGISPGVEVRFKSLHDNTGNLPLIEINESFDVFELVGRNTEESIVSGVLHGIRSEIDGIVDSYQENYDKLTCIITGGNWSYFAYSLKNKIFAHPNLVLFGLNSILLYNATEKN